MIITIMYALTNLLQELSDIINDRESPEELRLNALNKIYTLVDTKYELIQNETNYIEYNNYVNHELKTLENRQKDIRDDINNIQNKEILVLDNSDTETSGSLKLLETKENEYQEIEQRIIEIKSYYEDSLIRRIYGENYLEKEIQMLSDENNDIYNKIFEFKQELKDDIVKVESGLKMVDTINQENMSGLCVRVGNLEDSIDDINSNILHFESKIPDIENQLGDVENQLKKISEEDVNKNFYIQPENDILYQSVVNAFNGGY